jgi:hypothetical protein
MHSAEDESLPALPILHAESPAISIRSLWSRITELFWEKPLLLSAPILAADFAKDWILSAGKQLSRIVVYGLAPRSVLSGQAYMPTGSSLTLIAVSSSAVQSISYLLSFFLYSIAFLFVARSVHSLSLPPEPDGSDNPKSIIKPALKLAVILTGLTLCVGMLSVFLVAKFPHLIFSGGNDMAIWMALSASIAAIFATRPFLRAASPTHPGPEKFSTRVIVFAWAALSLGEALCVLLSFLLTCWISSRPPYPPRWFMELRTLMISLIATLPYIPMIIGITLLSEESIQPDTPLALPLQET